MNKILCVGTLIADIINEKVTRLPNAGECITSEVSLNLGGNAFSSSVNIKRLSAPDNYVYCYGLIGADAVGTLFENNLKEEGVISHISKIPTKKTSCNIILQEKDKDRRYIFNEGANLSATKEEIMKIAQETNPDIIMFGEMPSLGIAGDGFIELVNFIKTYTNSIICLDTLINGDEDYNWLIGNWNKIDIVHCNYGEGMHITKNTSHTEICSWFLKNGVTLAIVSNGEWGCHFGYNNAVEHVPAFNAVEIDATGAGDAMMAGIITKFLDYDTDINKMESDMIRKMIVYGSACGSYAVGSIGCISDISREKIENIITTQKKTGCAL